MVWQIRRDLLRRHLGSVTFHDRTRSIDQELREIPSDLVFTVLIGLRGRKEFVQVTRRIAIHIDLREDRKLHPVGRSRKLENFCIGSRLLRAKLITGEGKYVEPTSLIVFM